MRHKGFSSKRPPRSYYRAWYKMDIPEIPAESQKFAEHGLAEQEAENYSFKDPSQEAHTSASLEAKKSLPDFGAQSLFLRNRTLLALHVAIIGSIPRTLSTENRAKRGSLSTAKYDPSPTSGPQNEWMLQQA